MSYVDTLYSQDRYAKFVKKYKACFSGLGKLKGFQLKLHVDQNVKPVVQPMRKIPFNLRKSVNRILDYLLSQDIIKAVQGPTT